MDLRDASLAFEPEEPCTQRRKVPADHEASEVGPLQQ
jgi:hypothetical protein